MNLYWVETDDHHEDWFVVARTNRQAAKYHDDAEGYAVGDAHAMLVGPIPASEAAEVGWPSNALLERCGAEFLRADTPRAVKIAGRVYSEGMLQYEINQFMDDAFEARGQGRLNGTEPRQRI